MKRETITARASDWMHALGAVRWSYFALAFLMAATLWYLVTVRDKIETWVDVRVEFRSPPPDLVIREGLITKVSVRLRAAKGLVRGVTDRPFSVSVDLSGISKGSNTLTITREMLPFTGAYEIMDINPSRFEVEADAIAERTVPLESRFEGSLPPDHFVRSLQITPNQVSVRGPDSLVNTLDSVAVPVPLAEISRPGTTELQAMIPVPAEVGVTPERARLQLDIGLRTRPVKLTRDVTINIPEGVAVQAASRRVTLDLVLPESIAGNRQALDAVRVSVTVPTGVDGSLLLPIEVVLPENGSLISVTPQELAVTVLDGS